MEDVLEKMEKRESLAKKEYKILYHGTSVNMLKKMIKEKKMIPQGSEGSLDMIHKWGDYKDEHYYGFVFLAGDPITAYEYSNITSSHTGEYHNENLFVVLAVEVKKDLLLPDLNDAPDAKNWQESLDMVNQVSVEGNILDDAFRYVVIVDYENEDIIELSELEDWEERFLKQVNLRKKEKAKAI